MKTATLTFHNAYNYGAILQAYALQTFLISNKIENEIIDYSFNRPLGNITKKEFMLKKIQKIVNVRHYIMLRRRIYRFKEFKKNHLKIYNTPFIGDEEIEKIKKHFDVYIVGSDQIWNTSITNNSKAYFLHFVDDNSVKMAYAASIGKDYPNKVEEGYFREYLKSFFAISVREKKLGNILEHDFNIKSTHVLDPVYLLSKDEWERIMKPVKLPKKYILTYMIEFSNELIEKSKEFAKKTNSRVIFVSPSSCKYKGYKMNGIGPREFLNVLHNSTYIFTNSFHGIAFSLIFKKHFSVVRHSKLNTRIDSLLETLGIQDRYLDCPDHSSMNINYTDVSQKLNQMTQLSKEFLSQINQLSM